MPPSAAEGERGSPGIRTSRSETTTPRQQVKLLDLNSALEALEREHPSLAEVVEMHYFGGMTAEEASLAAGRSVHVVRHKIRLGRAWLRRKLSTNGPTP